jgi:hypothetical protein
VNCDMLAMALFLDCYTKRDLSDADRNAIESKWLGRWKDRLGNPARTPRQVMQTYCKLSNITMDSLDLAIDWECWPNTDPTEEEVTVSDLA